MTPYPDLQKKKEIVINAVEAFHKLASQWPALPARRRWIPKCRKRDARALQEMCERRAWQVRGYGPISYDIAMSKEIAAIKKV